MKTLIIYDNEGYIIDISSGQPNPRTPVGVPFLYEEIPQGKQIKSFVNFERVPQVDVTVEPHKLILEDIPPTEIDLLREDNIIIKQTVDSVGQELSKEKIKSMQKDAVITQLGGEVSKMKLDIIQMKGSVQ